MVSQVDEISFRGPIKQPRKSAFGGEVDVCVGRSGLRVTVPEVRLDQPDIVFVLVAVQVALPDERVTQGDESDTLDDVRVANQRVDRQFRREPAVEDLDPAAGEPDHLSAGPGPDRPSEYLCEIPGAAPGHHVDVA